jgi:hypothetical protein
MVIIAVFSGWIPWTISGAGTLELLTLKTGPDWRPSAALKRYRLPVRQPVVRGSNIGAWP